MKKKTKFCSLADLHGKIMDFVARLKILIMTMMVMTMMSGRR